MSEASFTAPPPPPPPPPTGLPPAAGATPTGFDFVKPFTFVFEDKRWVNKIFIGGLFYIASIFIVGIFFILGYCAQLARNVAAGMQQPLPEWDELGEYFSEGLRLFGVMLCYVLPMIILVVAFIVPVILAEAANEGDNDLAHAILSGTTGCVWSLVVLLSLAVTFFAPASLLMVAMEKRFSAGFEVAKIWDFIRGNIGNYILAVVVLLIARFLGGVGMILCCVGVFFSAFWAFLATTHGFGQVWKLAQRK